MKAKNSLKVLFLASITLFATSAHATVTSITIQASIGRENFPGTLTKSYTLNVAVDDTAPLATEFDKIKAAAIDAVVLAQARQNKAALRTWLGIEISELEQELPTMVKLDPKHDPQSNLQALSTPLSIFIDIPATAKVNNLLSYALNPSEIAQFSVQPTPQNPILLPTIPTTPPASPHTSPPASPLASPRSITPGGRPQRPATPVRRRLRQPPSSDSSSQEAPTIGVGTKAFLLATCVATTAALSYYLYKKFRRSSLQARADKVIRLKNDVWLEKITLDAFKADYEKLFEGLSAADKQLLQEMTS